jgi:hypothetical protein
MKTVLAFPSQTNSRYTCILTIIICNLLSLDGALNRKDFRKQSRNLLDQKNNRRSAAVSFSVHQKQEAKIDQLYISTADRFIITTFM